MKTMQWLAWGVCFCLIFVQAAHSYDVDCDNPQSHPPTCSTCPPQPPPGCEDDEVGANPIKPSRGEEKRFITDLETYGTAPIAFTRVYNSRTTEFTTNYIDFGWRQTWQHNWNYELRDLTSTNFGQKDVKLRYPTGNEMNFIAVSTNGDVRVPPAFFGDRLYKWTGTNVGHTLVTPNGWEYDFQRTTSPRYRLVRVRNGQGLTWTLSYNGQGKLERIENDFGRWLEIDRGVTNGMYCITGVRSSDGREVPYDYGMWQYTDISTSYVQQITCITNIYGEEGSQTWEIICTTNMIPVVTTNFVSNTMLVAANYPDGSRAEYAYVGAQSISNGRPLLATASDPRRPGAGARIKLAYNYDFIFDFGNGPYLVTGIVKEERNLDTDELIVSLPLGSGQYPQILLGDGTEITRKYTTGLLVERRDGEGRPTYYTRDQGGAGYIGAITDAESNTTTYVRDYAGRILEEIDPLGFTNSSAYNDAGFLTNRTDKLGRATAYTRDANNLLTRVDYPNGSFEEWTYNPYGQPLTHLLRSGGMESFSYYGTNEVGGLFGDLKSRTDAMSNTTAMTWNPAGLMTGSTDARGNATSFASDWRGQILAITNADNTAVVFQYDAFGNRTNAVDELGHATAYTFDQYNRVRTVRDSLGRVTQYEYGRVPGCGGCGVFGQTVTRITDPAGKVTEYSYDRSDKRTNETIAAGTAEAATTVWTYDAVGRLKTQTDANGNCHTWVYDPVGRVIAETNAFGDVTTYAYDAAGKLTNRVDGAGVDTFWEFDNMSRVTALGSGDLRYEYGYDLGGRRTAMYTRVSGDITETTTYSYDLRDLLLTKQEPSGYTLALSYDSIGSRTNFSVTSVTSVVNISYQYDARNRLTTMTGNPSTGSGQGGRTTSFEYDAAGRRTNAVWPNGTTAAYTYDVGNQLLSLIHGRAGSPNPPLASFFYAYDLSGNRTNMITLEGTNSYAYDARNWLTSATYPDGHVQEFEYDPLGNRTHLGGSGSTPTDYTYGPGNQLLLSSSSAETNEYFYNNAGRLISQTVNGIPRAYEYSFRSQMTSLTDTNDSIFAYTYDGDGNRTRQSLNACLTTRFVYDGPNVVLDLNASNELVHAYINGPGIDQPIERISFINGSPRIRHVYHADALGSIIAMTDDSGEPAKTYAYEAFGRIRSETGAGLVLSRYNFTAREAIGDSRYFCYYRARINDPSIGRFVSEDPVGFFAGRNLYAYVSNNPIMFFDPLGLYGDGRCDISNCQGPCIININSLGSYGSYGPIMGECGSHYDSRGCKVCGCH